MLLALAPNGSAGARPKILKQMPVETFLRDVIPPCLVLRVVDTSSNLVEILKCPVSGKFYRTRIWTEFNINPTNILHISTTTNSIVGIVSTDIMGYVSVTAKQGKTTFGYPFDYRPRVRTSDGRDSENFLGQSIMGSMVDGDFVSYISDGTNFSAWATFAAKDNALHWHDPETFAVLEYAPTPDADADFLYYRMQNTNTCCTIAGGLRRKHSGFHSFFKYGVEGAENRSRAVEVLRDVNWADNLLGGVTKWVREFKKTSIRDPRKFYVRLKSGARAFAMIHDSHRKLFSPITHAELCVSPDDIAGFEVIDDNSYPPLDCYTKNDVDALWRDYTSIPEDRSWFDRTCAELCGEHYIQGHPFRSLWGVFWYKLLVLFAPMFLFKKTRRWLLWPLNAARRVWCQMQTKKPSS